SPQFGERWARPWLDLAHYADSDGFEKDLIRPWAWRWRQWVIDALNRDLPFDQFTIEQLAGDLLPGGTVEQKVATGFLRQTLTNREAGVARAEDRFEQLVNRTNTIGTTWLGLTVGCAQCHNHKYDAFTQQDFYQLIAILNSSMEQTMDAPLAGEMGPWLREWPGFEKKRRLLLDEYMVAEYQAGWEEKMRKAVKNPGEDLEYDFWVTSMRVMLDHAERILLKPAAERTPREAWSLTEYFIGNPGPDLSRDKGTAEHFKSLRGHLAALNRTLTPLTQAYVMEEDPQAGKTFIAVKGDYKRPGVEVQPATPASLPPMQRANGEPARLAFARWLVSKDNPLTPRVIANRTWQELFGTGLVKTSEDFGVMGEKPSHPELLDWLASEFRDRGWSQKHLIRVMVTSAAYRQSSHARSDLTERDPENRLLARQNRLRLPAEAIRDAALTAGGLLNPQVGGHSVMPPMPAGVGELTYGGNKWKESQGTDRYRRGLYIHFQRTAPYPQLANFDAPDMQVACSRRRSSNTPLQSLNLLNDPVFFEAAQGLAARAAGEARGTFAERLDYVFQLALGRKPTARERERLARFFDEQSQLIAKEQSSAKLMAVQPEAAPWVAVSRVLLNLDEFMVKE
nr:DUF1549 and DUF1553 domain-containing protein [Bryobacter sp.]